MLMYLSLINSLRRSFPIISRYLLFQYSLYNSHQLLIRNFIKTQVKTLQIMRTIKTFK